MYPVWHTPCNTKCDVPTTMRSVPNVCDVPSVAHPETPALTARPTQSGGFFTRRGGARGGGRRHLLRLRPAVAGVQHAVRPSGYTRYCCTGWVHTGCDSIWGSLRGAAEAVAPAGAEAASAAVVYALRRGDRSSLRQGERACCYASQVHTGFGQ